MSEKGASVVEFAWASATWTAVCFFGLTCMGAAHARTWAHFELYEALICATENQTVEECESRHVRHLQRSVPYLSNIRIHISDGWASLSKSGVLTGSFAQFDLRMRLSLPSPGEVIR